MDLGNLNPITGVANAIGSLVKGVIDKAIPDATQAMQVKADLEKLNLASELQTALAQANIDLAEAQSSSVFKSDWRPFIGWVCGSAVAYHFVIAPLANGFGFHLPAVDVNALYPLMLGMLGLSASRTVEKLQDKDDSNK